MHLKVVYKSKYADRLKEKSEKEIKDRKDKHKEKKKKKDKERDRERERHRDGERPKHKHKNKDREREKEKLKKEYEKEKRKDREELVTDKNKDGSYKIKKLNKDDKVDPPLHKRVQEVRRERSKSIEKKGRDPGDKPRKALFVRDVVNVRRERETVLLSDSGDDVEPPVLQVREPAVKPMKEIKEIKEKVAAGVKRKASRDVRETAKKRRVWRQLRDESDESEAEVDLTPRQCHGR